MTNARFWTWTNGGPVKLTLRPGQSLTWHTHGPTDEGWSSETTTWAYDTDRLMVCQRWETAGTDCDGYLQRGGADMCPIHALADGNGCTDIVDGREVTYPAWDDDPDGRAWQRDHYAEAMGY